MVFLILLSLALIPIIASILFSFLLNVKIRIQHYYVIEAIIVLILTSIGQFYYYQSYELSLFPASGYIKFFLGVSLMGLILILLYEFIKRLFKKKNIIPFKSYAIICLLLVVLFIWLIPLGQKYYYADRLTKVEEAFSNEDSEKIVKDEAFLIGLAASEYDKFIRPRFRKPGAYNNYLYFKNNDNKPFTGHIYLTLFNEDKQSFEIKLLKDVEVESQDTQLLVIPEDNKLMAGKWDQRSFKSKQKVETFEAKIVSDD